MKSFEALGLVPELCRAIAEEGYTEPTPIQNQCIQIVLSGRDVIASAQTGSGKTAGFVLPVAQLVMQRQDPGPRKIRALILEPTREMVAQTEDAIKAFCRYTKLKSTGVIGGVGMNPQIHRLRLGVDILVATPGRLLDHVRSRTINLSQADILVLDEADRMVDMGFIHDVKRIMEVLPKPRQTLLFSATFSQEIRVIAKEFLRDPQKIEIARHGTPSELVTQIVHPVDRSRKRELLTELIGTQNWQQVLVFTRTKHGADRLVQQLKQDGIRSDAIHGNKSQGARMRALEQFKKGDIRVLVATDIASRGIDIDKLQQVVNFDLPNVPEDYIHRIGRTGRAGSEGTAYSLVSSDELRFLRDIERLLQRTIQKIPVAGFEPDPRSAGHAQPEKRPQRRQYYPRNNQRR